MKHVFSVLACLAMLAACNSADDKLYPSLAPRPIEKVMSPDAPPRPATQVDRGIDPALAARITAARSALNEAQASFDKALAEAPAAASGAEPGSEAWADNQLALSRLESARSQSQIVETDISALQLDLAQARVAGGDTSALEAEARALSDAAAALGEHGQKEIDRRR